MKEINTSSSQTRLKRIITVCEKKDISAWKITSSAILQRIAAEDYLLICPDSQINHFQSVTPADWRIIAESVFSQNCEVALIRERVRGENKSRVHWLFQQFLKLNSIVAADLEDGDAILIWDADTVPLRKLDFIEPETGRLVYYHGTENHSHYFETMEKLLGYGKAFEGSFIAQNLPIYVGWARHLIREIEANSGTSYSHAILDTLPGISGSEFSEYETLGTWAYRNRREQMIIRRKNRWLRCGTELLGTDPSKVRARILLKSLSLYYDYIAIENWRRDLSLGHLTSVIGRRAKAFLQRK